ncbi:MAG: cyclic nucleotide-binding domain-containing protein [Dehalococcoidia bacterium]
MDIEDRLANVPLFRDIPKKSLKRLAETARPREYKAGQTIITEGDEGVAFYLVTGGSAQATRGGAQLATFKEGDFFGEMALLDNHRRSATIVAATDVKMIAISRWDFLSEVRDSPDMALALLETMSRRIRELDERLAGQ